MTNSSRPIESTSEILKQISAFDDRVFSGAYKDCLKPGFIWRLNSDPLKMCKIEEAHSNRVSAFWLRYNDFGDRCVRKYEDDFLSRTGVFLRQFSPESEIQTLTTLVSSVKSVALASQNKAVSACRSIIEKRIDALCEVVDEKEKDLLLKTKEILLTDIKNFHF
jgi:hypothetical protein